MVNCFNAEQGSEDWINFRKSKRNASETPAIMGLCKYMSPNDVRKVKSGILKVNNIAVNFGKDNEKKAIEVFNKIYSTEMKPVTLYEDDYSASLDGIDISTDSILEVKCPFSGRAGERWLMAEKGIPTKYDYIQVQHQLMVSKAKIAHLWIFDPKTASGIKIDIKPNEEDWEIIKKEWDIFCKTLKNRDDKEWVKLTDKYVDLKKTQDKIKSEIDEIKNKIINLSNGIECQGNGVRVLKVKGSKKIDWESIKNDYLSNVNLDKYTKKLSDSLRIVCE
jgi:putative phage-type endonuclease